MHFQSWYGNKSGTLILATLPLDPLLGEAFSGTKHGVTSLAVHCQRIKIAYNFHFHKTGKTQKTKHMEDKGAETCGFGSFLERSRWIWFLCSPPAPS